MSPLTDRLTEEDLRELARLIRRTHARAAAKREREKAEAAAAEDSGRAAGAGGESDG